MSVNAIDPDPTGGGLPALLVVGDTPPIREVRKTLERRGFPVLVMDGQEAALMAKRAVREILEQEALSMEAVKCCDPEDTSKRQPNQPWYNDLRPGGKKSHRGKRNRSGNHW